MPNGKPVNNSHYKVNTLPLGAIFTKKDSMLKQHCEYEKKYPTRKSLENKYDSHWRCPLS